MGLVKAGLPENEAGEALQIKAFKESVDSDWALSDKMGISAVPIFTLNGRTVVGAQPYDVLERFLRENGVEKK
jgi:predicted DsbA family dithiol-disulfide isomerase